MPRLPLPKNNSEQEFERLVQCAREAPHSPDEVADLALHLANSGERISWPDTDRIADVASTGGPGSLSTLLPALALRARGCRVVKLAVPGRPAGAIDSLGTIPGYRVRLTTEEVRQIVMSSGFAHFLADDRFAALDADLFAYRQRTGAVAVPALAAASLLAKKIAVGLGLVGLDVRVGVHGNFGRTREEARINAALFCGAARILGIGAVVFISDASGPPQPWIGRGESLCALAHAIGVRRLDDPHSWLSGHIHDCGRMAEFVIGVKAGIAASQLPDDAFRCALEAHLESQGTTMDALLRRVDAVSNARHVSIEANASGLLEIDLAVLRNALVDVQHRDAARPFHDPAGVCLFKRAGSPVDRGDRIAEVRLELDDVAAEDQLCLRVKKAFHIVSEDVAERCARHGKGFDSNASGMEVIYG